MGIISIYFYNNIIGNLLIEWINRNIIYIKKGINKIKNGGLLINIINILIINIILIGFNKNYLGFQYIENILNINWGIDGISLIFLILIVILGPITLIASWKSINQQETQYLYLINILLVLMVLNFLCLDLISFYIFYESTLIPLFILIGIYGSNKKDDAAYSVLIYTLFSSLFMLLSIILYKIVLKSTDYSFVNCIFLSTELQSLLFIGIMIGLAIKTPLVPIHTWLPLVHSESPLGGSILLAGVILKLSIYGILRLLLPNLSEITLVYVPLMYLIGLITIIYSSFVTLVQTDLKVIIAYSSIAHLGICIIGIFANNVLGISGSLMLCFAHGFVSPALFILVGGILYDRFHSRLIFYYQGLITYMPLFSIYLIIFSFANAGTPLSANFIGEFLSISGGILRHPLIGSLCASSVLLSACYQMKLTNRLTNGTYSLNLGITNDLTSRELFILNILLFFTVFFGIYPNCLISLFDLPITYLTYVSYL